MKTFLEYVANDLYQRYGTDMSHVAIIFPNKRASLFIGEYLVAAAGKPIWSPATITISELFSRHSSRHIADNLTLVCLLYRCYVEVTGSDEDIDHFFSWGEVMLADFDDIDKCMADAKKVFSSINDLHALDDTSYLTDEQRSAIESFFGCFNDKSALRERFLHLWERLYEIYALFNERLAAEGLSYEGSLYREAVDDAATWSDYDCFVFVGFNVLSQVERALFTTLHRAGKALFYWDYDTYYTSSSSLEAGRHITRHLDAFPNTLDNSNGEIYSNFVSKKNITCIAATTENIQARYVADWLEEEVEGMGKVRIAAGRRTAVVLCDESLLLPVIHSIPEEVREVNITGGYPLAQTPIATTVHQSFDRLARSGKHDALTIIRTLRDEVEATALNTKASDPLTTESLFRMYTLLTRLVDMMTPRDDGSVLLEVKPVTAHRLLTQAIRSTSVPFHGEPAVGVQVMGMLETRNLDFHHLLILSANEGNMPRVGSDTSFIPYNVRVGYELTTMDHKTDIYAYYFYRLLQRARDITIVYSTSAVGVGAKELSRYVQQLIVESPHTITRKALRTVASPMQTQKHDVEKGKQVLATLRRLTKLSPTAINTYLNCGKRFYYKYVVDIRELQEDEEVVDNRIFGNIFHAAAQELYSPYVGQVMPRTYLQELLNDPSLIERAIDNAIAKECVSTTHGLTVITKAVVTDYLHHLINNDLEVGALTIEALEEQFYRSWTTHINKKPHSIEVGGFVDRLDMVSDENGSRLRVIDYKTGKGKLGTFNGIDDIFMTSIDQSDYYLQAFLYSVIIREKNPDMTVSPALLFIQRAKDNPDPTLVLRGTPVTDVQAFSSDFIERLSRVIDEIFDSTVPFIATTNEKVCTKCPYATLCLAGQSG